MKWNIIPINRKINKKKESHEFQFVIKLTDNMEVNRDSREVKTKHEKDESRI